VALAGFFVGKLLVDQRELRAAVDGLKTISSGCVSAANTLAGDALMRRTRVRLGSCSSFVILFRQRDKSVEAHRPEALIPFEPLHRLAHRLDGEVNRHGSAGFGSGDQAGVGEDVQVLHQAGEL